MRDDVLDAAELRLRAADRVGLDVAAEAEAEGLERRRKVRVAGGAAASARGPRGGGLREECERHAAAHRRVGDGEEDVLVGDEVVEEPRLERVREAGGRLGRDLGEDRVCGAREAGVLGRVRLARDVRAARDERKHNHRGGHVTWRSTNATRSSSRREHWVEQYVVAPVVAAAAPQHAREPVLAALAPAVRRHDAAERALARP